ncbi:hypothetical protein MLD38_032622 [Melastoma candidum]|uniref:Uncharacterized protein n=1 Tax=Melastoma candidum TaxID=119954 RepID=A0ACB9M4D2_9MYRT|nr:hypothetical protein MLD38_032622 [Melastoma candidum]
MAQSTGRAVVAGGGVGGGGPGGGGRIVGDYLVGKQIGSGSFSVVWHARHRVHGTEVAIKEIATGKLNKKLQESLISEIHILKKINHPNIVRLHDIIEVPGKINLVLEYCKGGDLSMYINRHGRVPEEIAKHFMQQLAMGLKVLRDNNLIHRDLKPQNLLLSTNEDRSSLKIADFGFARSLQPRGLAETLCGSPLYMAPEIMQLQKYDAKADLWSVGTILYQLVTGRTPFNGNNQIQLLQNVVKSNELQFPPNLKDISSDCKDLCQKLLRRYPVERLTFEEFFNHQFFPQNEAGGSLRSQKPSGNVPSFPWTETDLRRRVEDSSNDDCFQFSLDDVCSGSSGSPSSHKRSSSMERAKEPTYSLKADKKEATNCSSRISRADNYAIGPDVHRPSVLSPNNPLDSSDHKSMNVRSRVSDSLDLIEQDYVIVSSPPMDARSSSVGTSKPISVPYKSGSLPQESHVTGFPSSAPVPIINAAYNCGGLEGHGCNPLSYESMDNVDTLEKPSSHRVIRIKSLQQSAYAIKELVNGKIDGDRYLEAFSVQLVILAIWKQALHICHTQAASAVEGSPRQGIMRSKRNVSRVHGNSDLLACPKLDYDSGVENVSTLIESEFLREFGHAEELSKYIEPGSTEMPDAMETIFQAALVLGKQGGVDELMGDTDTAALLYSKAVHLLVFLLVEAPSLILNPPFSLTNSDRFRLRNYIDILRNRQAHIRSQGLSADKDGDCQGTT